MKSHKTITHNPLNRPAFIRRLRNAVLIACALITVALVMGMIGYHLTCGLDWIDSFLNASMILTGMGPIDQMKTSAAKIFAGFYALFSGVTFPTTVGILLSPLIHRFLHQIHAEANEKDDSA